MTVAELIVQLQKMPQNAECVCGVPIFGGASAVRRGAFVMRAVPDGEPDWFRFIASDADARTNLIHVRPVVLIE